MKESTRKTTVFFILFCIVFFHIAVNLYFIRVDQRPANINELSHVMGAVDFLNLLFNQPDKHAAYMIAFSGYPPAGIAASIAYGLFGRTHDSAVASQLFFSVIAILAVFGIGRRWFSDVAGLLAATFLVLSPSVCEVSRQYLLEWPLTALSALSVYFIHRSDGYRIKKYSFLAGAAVGAAALAKQTVFIFLAGPVLMSVGEWVFSLRNREKTKAVSFQIIPTAASIVLGIGLAWFLYPQSTRQGIDVWFKVAGLAEFPWGLTFFILTALMTAAVFLLAYFGRGPLVNGIGAGILAVLVASVWYFPKGISNFLTYAGQMEMNVVSMNPASLMKFYYSYLNSYYIGVLPLRLFLGVTLLVVISGFFPRMTGVKFADAKNEIPFRPVITLLAWFLIPVVSFFFINIQNEMNLVPLMPSICLVLAFIVTRLFEPIADKEWRANAKPAAKIFGTGIGTVGILAVTAMILAGLASAGVFPDGKGGYRPLPLADSGETVARYFPRKNNSDTYLVPMTRPWHVQEIVRTIIAETHREKPEVLSMDVDFYFSWNTFWYEFKLSDREVNVSTQWIADQDMLSDPKRKGGIETYDAIVYREPWKKVYAASQNDYIDYKNLWRTYEFLAEPSEEFASLYRERARYALADGTTAILLLRNPGAPAGDAVTPPQSP